MSGLSQQVCWVIDDVTQKQRHYVYNSPRSLSPYTLLSSKVRDLQKPPQRTRDSLLYNSASGLPDTSVSPKNQALVKGLAPALHGLESSVNAERAPSQLNTYHSDACGGL